MTHEKEKGATPFESAPENITDTADCTALTFIPRGGMDCFVCQATITPTADDMVQVGWLSDDLSLAVAVCPVCRCRAQDQDGSLAPLIADIRATYSGGVTAVPPAAQRRPASVELARHPVRNAGRKHPPYGAALAESPPPAGEPLRVLLGWEHAKIVPDPKVIIRPEDNPTRLRFDVAMGRDVRVDHEPDADPDRLLKLAQALIDYGARQVEMVTSGASGTEMLRVLPKGQA